MTPEQIIKVLEIIAGVITALATIVGVPTGAVKLYKKHKAKMIAEAEAKRKAEEREDRQDADIRQNKEENCLMMYGLSACLDGLIQMGCNHAVPDAKEKIDKYLNVQAHK